MSGRPKIPIESQVRVFYRDGWICRWCYRPTVFSPTMRLVEHFVRTSGSQAPLAYFHPRWRRDAAPLLDHFGAVIDHIDAYSTGGLHVEANFVTACNKCNMRKSARRAESYVKERPGRPVKGRFGEPKYWDGLASLFVTLASDERMLSVSERAWKRALLAHMRR